MANISAGSSHPQNQSLSFENTEIAFKGKSNADLSKAYWLFKVIGSRFLTWIGPPLTTFSFKLGIPVEGAIKSTIFRQFCGGENIAECDPVIAQLARGGVGTILDYAVEGGDEESTFVTTCQEIIRTIERAKGDERIPFSVFKVTGVARAGLLAKLDAGQELSDKEQAEYVKTKGRIEMICRAAAEADVPVMMDAEDSWMQDTMDKLSLDMMRRYNRDKIIVYNTYQLYRHDKLASLKTDIEFAKSNGFMFGAKLVRGAYMEKERERAKELGYPSPIQPDKASTDSDYNAALEVCIQNIEHVAVVAGTHNEDSCKYLVDLLAANNIQSNHPNVYFSQLLGMSDNLSFNLANAGYNVAKYVPYGPVKAVMPYLFRRAQENTSIAGQTGRELSLIITEKRRRKA